MAMQFSTLLRNSRADNIETFLGAAPTLEIRTGAAPAATTDADSGTLLAAMTLPSDFMAAASGGAKALAGSWQDAAANEAGYAGHFRIKAASGSAVGIQGKLFMDTDAAPAWAISTAYTVGQIRTNGARVYICTVAGTSAGAGGPTGTGTGTTDGTAEWNYLCDASGEMEIDNAAINVGQQVNVTAFTITEGNA